VNVATANQARFSALLVESENKGGLEGALREQGCSVRRVTSRAAAHEAVEGTDIIVISSAGFADDDVIDLIGKAQGRQVLVVAESQDLAVKAAKQGAMVAGSFELASAQLTGLLTIVDLKRKVRTAGPVSLTSPTSGVVQRRSTPLPKEATPDALEALIEAAECLVPMHRFQRVYVDYALRRFGGNKVHTAAALGIDRRTIQRWARARAETTTTGATTQSTTSS
jgi:DNA-binding NtrC family response regulator